MKIALFALAALPFFLFSQTARPDGSPDPVRAAGEKGVNPVAAHSSKPKTQSAARAVVIGISNYQDEQIPDLRFADKDALAFANFLKSPAGGGLGDDRLQILLNQHATAGRVAEALDALVEQTKEGEQVIIYFSGHGDVERKTVSQPGFLLCWDSPSRIYMGGGTYSLAFLQEIVSTLSTQNQAKVVVITDACHAGKLAGNQIGGSQLTAANLARQFANETKILSCQPGELSLEGEQWGGGRGIFSYHLVDGLFGLADRNGDGQVTLGEIDRYLEDKVTAEAAPQSQVPMLLGNKTENLATVNPAILADLKKAKASPDASGSVFAATESRGLEDAFLAKADSSLRGQYLAFKKAIAEKRFFPAPKESGYPENDCAEFYYTQLLARKELADENGLLAPLRGMLKRNYAAALQDDAQQTLNEWLKTGPALAESAGSKRPPQKLFTEKVRTYPRCLDRAAELLGQKHYMYAALKARKFFFEGFLLANSNYNPDREHGNRALGFFRQSLAWQPEQPQVYWQMGNVFGFNFQEPDSLEFYARRAMELHPNWIVPCLHAAFILSHRLGQFDRARPFLESASSMDTATATVWDTWAVFNYDQKNYAEAERQLKKAIALDSTVSRFWNNLSYLYLLINRYPDAGNAAKKAIALDSTKAAAWHNLGESLHHQGRYAESEPAFLKALSLDSTLLATYSRLGSTYYRAQRFEEAERTLKKGLQLDPDEGSILNNLGYLYILTKRFAEAEPIFKQLLAADSTFLAGWNNLGNIFRETGRLAEADRAYQKAFALDKNFYPTWFNAAQLKIKTGEVDLAFDYLDQAIQKGRLNYEPLQKNADLAPLRTDAERWKALMKKHFPDKAKD